MHEYQATVHWERGDQLFTDILGGNWSGMFTIMVRPISDNALPHTRLTRRLERLVLKRYGHDWPRQRHEPQRQEILHTLPVKTEDELNTDAHTNGRQD